ncbi:MAG: hypothetical protein MZV64_11535 [Ignavibacteriales bacterium]|nr:hypothetical protein [Ignavibacteriales bacterium]MCK7518301.1 hypothetical protein [Ignavibacteriales bacterium]
MNSPQPINMTPPRSRVNRGLPSDVSACGGRRVELASALWYLRPRRCAI